MTSVSIVSAVAARIQLCLPDESKLSQGWRNDAREFLPGLDKVKLWLQRADQETKHTKPFVELEKKIVQLCYEIDDAIAASDLGSSFPSSSSSSKMKGRISGMFQGNSDRSSKSDLKSLRTQLDNITKRLDEQEVIQAAPNKKEQTKKIISRQTSIHQANPESPTTSTSGEDPPQIEIVKAALLRQDLPVVCIWGKRGMGKTTLAEKAFNHPEVRREFQLFAWVPINRDFQTKDVLQSTLLQLLPDEKGDISWMDEIELTLKVFIVLKENKCLVVLDDIGESPDDWRSIRIAFPIDQSSSSSSKSKILITTSSREVAEVATTKDGVYEMKPLTEAECLKILRENANLENEELESVGKKIFHLSGGSPLIAVILGNSLKTVDPAVRNQLDHELDSYLNKMDLTDRAGETVQVLGLSYDRLPHELKPCLLYMGQFPKGSDIDVQKLYLLWAAEHLTISMESVRSMLGELATERLIEVQEDNVLMTRLMYKSCRLDDQVRDFCISKGLEEGFFEVVDFKSDKKKLRPSTCRLAVHNLSKCDDVHAIQFSSQDMEKKIRCLLIFDTYESQQKSTWPGGINDLKEFTHLRVLHFDGVDFRARKYFPRGIDKLVFLRYLSFQGCCLEDFPSSISKLLCLETLDLRVTPNCKMILPNIFSNMKRLRHLYFPMFYESDGNNKLELKDMERLEILVNFYTGACNLGDLFPLKKLQVLKIISDGNHKDLEVIINCLDEKAANLQHSSLDIKNFDCYSRDRVAVFKKLLECKSLHSLHVEGQIGKLPEDVKISPSFTEFVLNGSELEVDPIGELGKLENLRSLVLEDDAFVGTEMTFSAASRFSNLRILKLANLEYLEKLTFEERALPELSTLVIENCDELGEVLMPKEMHSRLQHARGKKGGDVYFVEPWHAIKLQDN